MKPFKILHEIIHIENASILMNNLLSPLVELRWHFEKKLNNYRTAL